MQLRPESIDETHKIAAFLSVELPFWISIESGKYPISNNRIVDLRNDLFLVSIGNMFDGPLNIPYDFVVNETQVIDQKFLDHNFGKTSLYFHKQKMKTTFTRGFEICPIKGALTAQFDTDEWLQQLNRVIFSLIPYSTYEEFLEDINSYIDQYCAQISTSNTIGEVRNVSFYELAVRMLVTIKMNDKIILYPIRAAPDFAMAGVPYPPFKVRKKGDSEIFRDIIKDSKPPVFHQLQWAKTLNHYREKRLQEALVSAAITLEALVHRYLIKKGISSKEKRKDEIKKQKGLAGWIRNLETTNLDNECKSVAKLWLLRNKIVHDQKQLSVDDKKTIIEGILSVGKLRSYMMKTINPDLLKFEEKFSSFLEPIQIGTAAMESIGQAVAVKLEWRKEKDHYQLSVEKQMATEK